MFDEVQEGRRCGECRSEVEASRVCCDRVGSHAADEGRVTLRGMAGVEVAVNRVAGRKKEKSRECVV